jgi:hypothetical protein
MDWYSAHGFCLDFTSRLLLRDCYICYLTYL